MKLTVIGGGGVRSLMLAKSLAQNAKEYNITHIVFMDNNVQKLNIFGALAREVAIRIMPSLDFTLTTNPVEAIQSADYIITTIRAGEDDMRIRDERIALAGNDRCRRFFLCHAKCSSSCRILRTGTQVRQPKCKSVQLYQPRRCGLADIAGYGL